MKVAEVQKELKTADDQIAEALVEIENPKSDIVRQYKRAIARQPKCTHVTIVGGPAPSTEHGQHSSGELFGGGGVIPSVVCKR